MLKAQGDYAGALVEHRKCLAIREKRFGPGNRSLAPLYNSMANVFEMQGDYERALEYHGKALAIKEPTLLQSALEIEEEETDENGKNGSTAY